MFYLFTERLPTLLSLSFILQSHLFHHERRDIQTRQLQSVTEVKLEHVEGRIEASYSLRDRPPPRVSFCS